MLIRNHASQYSAICHYFLDRIPDVDTNTHCWRMRVIGDVVQHDYIGDEVELKKWKRSYHQRYGVTTWCYTGDDDDLIAGRVGTDGRTIIKFVNHNDYDFVRTEDFITRGQLIVSAFQHESIRHQYFNHLSRDDYDVILRAVSSRLNVFCNSIEALCSLDVTQMTGEGCVDYFTPRCQTANELLATLFADLVDRIQLHHAGVKKSKIIADLEMAERLHIIDRGRPVFIKVGTLHERRKKILSAQFPQGKQTVPSSYRDRQVIFSESKQPTLLDSADEDSVIVPLLSDEISEDVDSMPLKPLLIGPAQVMLSNHVVDLTAVVTGRQVESLVEVIGHSSYPPIGVKDELKRRYLAYQAVLENIRAMASHELLSMGRDESSVGTEGNPLKLNIASMLLLTPFVNKWIDGLLRKLESEDSQAAESAMAIEMVKHQSQPMKMSVNGRVVYVQVDFSYMNVPVNVSGVAQGVLSEHSLQQRINSRGFYQYSQNVENVLSSLASNLSGAHSELMKQVLISWQSLREKNSIDEQLTDQVRLLHETIVRYKKPLSDLHQQSLHLFERYLHTKDEAEKELVKNEYRSIRHRIIDIENICHAYYIHVLHRQKELFEANKSQIDQSHGQLKQLLASQAYSESEREFCLLLQRYLRAQQMYYHKEYKNDLYHFQVLYLLSCAQVGQKIEAFCKSAEDRTGWCRVMLMAYSAFHEQYGRDPDIHNTRDKAIFHDYLVSSRQLSASIENTEANSDARGMQVNSATTGVMSNDICNQQAKLAKCVIKRAKEIAKSREQGFFDRHPVVRDVLIGAVVGLVVIGMIVATVATLGAFAPGLGITLGGLALVGGSIGGTVGIASGIVAGFALFTGAVGAMSRSGCSEIEMQPLPAVPENKHDHVSGFNGSTRKIKTLTHSTDQLRQPTESDPFLDSDLADDSFPEMEAYTSDEEERRVVIKDNNSDSGYSTEYSF